MAERIYNWGIIGPGKIARKFADDLQRLPNARLHAVASTSMERARAFAQNYEGVHVYDRYDALMDCPDLDIVYIATPHIFHYEQTMMCLRSGLSVLCEKPFAMHPWQVEEMIALARERQLFLMEALWTFFIPGFRAAMDLVEQGAIGKVHTAKADFGFVSAYNPQSRLYNPALGGGSLLDIGIYPALLMLRLLGMPPMTGIQAAANFTPDGVDESCVFTLHYPDHRLAIGHSTVVAHTPTEATVFGTLGQVHLNTRFHHPHQISVMHYAEGNHYTVHDYPYEGWGYQFEAAHVMACLAAGKTESDIVSHDFTLNLSRLLAGISERIGLRYA